ncbi:RNA-directed DNA polymerase, eukaryota, partial [Tanacetum coccineum]
GLQESSDFSGFILLSFSNVKLLRFSDANDIFNLARVDGEKHLKHLKSQDSMIYLKYQRTMMMSGLLLGTLHELIMVLISDYVEGRPGDKVEGDDEFRFVFGLNPTSLVIVFVMGFHHQNSLQSKLDQTAKISKSVFITNFSEECTSKDLWKVCNDYGTVIDVFIPNKRSKSGKRFAFVRFIKVSNLDRLVENLNTIWMGRFHLSANRARFDRPVVSPAPKQIPGIMSRPKYVQPNAIPKEKVSSPPYLLKPSLVIDDSCLVSRDLDNCVMGEVRLWVMIELNSPKAKANLLQHVGVASWFSHIGKAQLDFAAKERIVWVDIEGVPLNAWSHPTFKKIGSIWGEMVDLEEENNTQFARKRICIKTSHMENILESFKLIVKGKVFWVRAKELFTWVPSFKTVPVNEVSLDDESVKANDMDNRAFDNEEESESEVVSDTVFGDYDGDQAAQGPDNQNEVPLMAKATSSDPFNIYGMLNKRTKKGKASKSDSSVPYPPGFTPALNVKANNKETDPVEYNHLSGKSENSNSKVLEEGEMSANSAPHVNSSAVSKSKEGGSILEILEEMITVGQTMGFSMECCVKDMEKIIGTQGELDSKQNLKLLKVEIRKWTKDFKEKHEGQSRDLNLKLRDIDKTLDQGGVTDDLLLSRMELMKQIQDIHKSKHRDSMQKAKVRWAIEGDENSKYFHAIINKNRANLSVKGVMVDGDWVVDPILVKKEFCDHFADRFQDPGPRKGRINFQFPNRLSSEQVVNLETRISTDEIRSAVWGCGVDKSPGPDGFTFDFFRK